jgi:MYXO-CTERM domain-containing protein
VGLAVLGAVAACQEDSAEPSDAAEPGSGASAEHAEATLARAQRAFPGVWSLGNHVELSDAAPGRLDVVTGAGSRAFVSIPTRADGRIQIRDAGTGVGASVAIVDATDAAGAASDGVITYPAAGPGGADLFAVPGPDGVEDFAVYWQKPKSASLTYRMALDRVAGLRLVRGSLELLDAGGVPRVRVRHPWVIDASGRRHDAALEVRGCPVDEGAGAPWARQFVEVEGDTCDLVVNWNDALEYPVLVDPQWETTAAMTDERTHHTATLIGGTANPRVLVVGGFDDAGSPLGSIELFCPAEACGGTAAFTQLGISLATPRGDHTETRLDVGTDQVLITGGRSTRASTTGLASAEVLDLSNQGALALVSGVSPMSVGRDQHTATSLGASGKVLVAGGEDNVAVRTGEVYNPATKAFEPAGSGSPPMVAHRRGHGAARLLDGRVLIAGGVGNLGLALSSAELYDPVAGTFTASGNMTSQRAFATTTLFDGASGNVLIAGGTNAQGFYYKTADIFVAATGTFQQQPVVMQVARAFHAATPLLGQGTVLLTGGFDGTDVLDATEVFDQQAAAFSLTSTMKFPHDFHTATRLPSGKAVVIGGGLTGTAVAPGSGSVLTSSAIQAEILLLSNGEPCNTDGECADEHCWRESNTAPVGMCCDRECGDICSSCLQSKKADGSANGTCSVVTDGTSVQQQCQNDVAFELKCQSGQVTTTNVDKCEPYVCLNAAACRTKCTQDVHCDARYWCGQAPGAPANSPVDCQPDLQNGEDCTRTEQCASGFCVDGVCCNNGCGDLCQACDVPGFIGSCVQVPSGPPHGDRGECEGAGGPCEGECREKSNACTYDQNECGESSCSDGSRSFNLCSVVTDGVCTPQEASCGDYACADDKVCVPEGTCTTTANCAGGAVCILATGQCAVVESPKCVEEHFVVSPDGTSTDCSPLKCGDSGCLNRCLSIDDCVDGKVCDASGACIDPPADPPPPEDCNASAGTASRGGAAGVLALLGLAVMGARRKRRKPVLANGEVVR